MLVLLGGRAMESGWGYLIAVAVPANLAAAVVVYLGVRTSAAVAKAGVIACVALTLAHLFVTLGLAAWWSGFLQSGGSTTGTHTFTWGMGFAYLEAIHDTHRGTWFGEAEP